MTYDGTTRRANVEGQWIVVGSRGAVVRDASALSGNVVGHLPKDAAFTCNGCDGALRLSIEAPVVGWLSAKLARLVEAEDPAAPAAGSFRAFQTGGDRATARALGALSWECRQRATTLVAPAETRPQKPRAAVARAEGGAIWGGTARFPTRAVYTTAADEAAPAPLTVGDALFGDSKRHRALLALRAREKACGGCKTGAPCGLGPPPPGPPPLVSVLACTYPPRHRLHEALYAAFKAQTYPNLELVVYDTDGPPSPFFAALNTDKRVRYYHGGRQYVAGAAREATPPSWTHVGAKRNALNGLARGEICVLFDDDNVYAPCYCETMVGHLRSSGGDLVRLRGWRAYDATRDRFCISESQDVRCESFVFTNRPRAPGFDIREDRGEEGSFFDGRVVHDVRDSAGIFLKIHHGQNSSETPVTADLAAARIPRALLDGLDVALYARDVVFTGAHADDRTFDPVSATTLGYDVGRARR